jgi:undecaprenyl pyrophosphate phosphatase UppP
VDAALFVIQAIATALVVVVFVDQLRKLLRESHRSAYLAVRADSAAIIGASVLVIALFNVVTSLATAYDLTDVRNFAGTVIRGTLFVLAVYLMLAGPFPVAIVGRARRRFKRRPMPPPTPPEGKP